MPDFLSLQSVETVLAHIATFSALPAETLGLEQACGRRLAHAFYAPADLPGFDRSTMDGFAVNARDVFGAQEGSPALLECVGECPMGGVPGFALQPGQCARILTGGMLPQGADCVVMVEYSRPAGGNLVELTRTQAPGDNVLMHDEDAAQGAELIPAGTLLRPQEIGLLAAFGLPQAEVCRQARIAIISTGDEVVPLEKKPAPGQVRDVNSYTLAALCHSAGAFARRVALVGDDLALLKSTVESALAEFDVVVLSGGSSAGMRDHTVDVFRSVPHSTVLTHGVAISPGKPFILARAGAQCLMGLPGHVTSALICARVFLLPLIQQLQGKQPHNQELSPTISAQLARAVASAQGRRDYIRVRLTAAKTMNADSMQAKPLLAEAMFIADPISGPSGLLSGLAAADGLLICPENREGFKAGETVSIELMRAPS